MDFKCTVERFILFFVAAFFCAMFFATIGLVALALFDLIDSNVLVNMLTSELFWIIMLIVSVFGACFGIIGCSRHNGEN